MNKQEAIEKIEQSTIKIPKRVKVISKADNVLVETGFIDYVPLDVVVNTIDKIHEPQKVVVPKFVAEWYDRAKQQNFTLRSALEHWKMSEELEKWFQYSYNQETFARAWLDGYEIEKEKLYTVELFNGQPLVEVNNVLFFSSDLAASNVHVSKDKLEAAGLGWVFDCNGVKVVEVE
ncbi:TPA: DUF1642 domain-containing protein [Streptococcus suis]